MSPLSPEKKAKLKQDVLAELEGAPAAVLKAIKKLTPQKSADKPRPEVVLRARPSQPAAAKTAATTARKKPVKIEASAPASPRQDGPASPNRGESAPVSTLASSLTSRSGPRGEPALTQPRFAARRGGEPVLPVVPAINTKECPPKDNLPLFWRWVFAVILIIILAMVIDVIGIYKFSWQNSFNYQIAKFFNLPAGTVNGQVIKLSDYLDNVGVLQTAINNDREGIIFNGQQIGDAKQQIFYVLAADDLVKVQLKKYNQAVAEEDLNDQIDSIINQLGGDQKASEVINQLYGLSLTNFKNKILRPLMNRELLQELIIKDENLEINKNAKARAEEVLRLALEPKVDFKDLAKQYTEDEAGVNTGGDLGLFIKGELAPDLETIVFSLPANTVYDKLFANTTGYHVIKVDNKLTDPDTGRQSVKVSHILIKVDVNQYIKDLLDRAVIKKFVK